MQNNIEIEEYDAEVEEQILDEIRRRVFAKEAWLEEKLRNHEIHEINISILEEMTDVLTSEEIREIAKQVREEYRQKNIQTSGNPSHEAVAGWFGLNKAVIISIALTVVICFFGIIQMEDMHSVYALAFFGFPFIIILFGILYSIASLFKSK